MARTVAGHSSQRPSARSPAGTCSSGSIQSPALLWCPASQALRLSSACPPGWHWSHLPVQELWSSWVGYRLLVPALVFLALSASVFRSERHRDTATVMWGLGIAALLGSEWLVIDDLVWRSVAFAATAALIGLLARPLRESRLWEAAWGIALGVGLTTIAALAWAWVWDGAEPARYAIAPLTAVAALALLSALSWRISARRDRITAAWATAIVALIFGEAFLVGGGQPVAILAALTGAAAALLWIHCASSSCRGRTIVISVTSAAVLVLVTPLEHFFVASASPGKGLGVGARVSARRPRAPIRRCCDLEVDRPDPRRRGAVPALARNPRAGRASLRRLRPRPTSSADTSPSARSGGSSDSPR